MFVLEQLTFACPTVHGLAKPGSILSFLKPLHLEAFTPPQSPAL